MTECLERDVLVLLDECITFETAGDNTTYVNYIQGNKAWYFDVHTGTCGYERREWLNGANHIKLPTTDIEIEYALKCIRDSSVGRDTERSNLVNYIESKYGS